MLISRESFQTADLEFCNSSNVFDTQRFFFFLSLSQSISKLCQIHLWVGFILRSQARLRWKGWRQAETSTLTTFQKIQTHRWSLLQIMPLLAMQLDMQQKYWLFSLEKFHMWHITSSHKGAKWNKVLKKEKIRWCVRIQRSYKSLSPTSFPLIRKQG